jgi:hypothetical protein
MCRVVEGVLLRASPAKATPCRKNTSINKDREKALR